MLLWWQRVDHEGGNLVHEVVRLPRVQHPREATLHRHWGAELIPSFGDSKASGCWHSPPEGCGMAQHRGAAQWSRWRLRPTSIS